MASIEEHIEKAENNEAFSLSIKNTPYLDWVVTGIFYSALHYTEGYLATKGEHPDNHPFRNELIQEDPNLGWRFYSKMYKHLRDDSYEARYQIRTFAPEEIQNDIIPLLEAIKNHLKKFVPQIKIT
jgi:uncharacterized protein (UPF0332 family)